MFRGPIAETLLRTYLLASNAGRAVARKMRSDDTLAFEQALLSLREDGSLHRRQMSLALPPYLQALMLSYSEHLHADAERYSVLIDELLTLPTQVYFVSLNYDTLLDANLSAFSPLQSIGDYVSDSRKWSLLKPHGSAKWFVELSHPLDMTAPPENFEVPDWPIWCMPARSGEGYLTRGNALLLPDYNSTRRYPAIALPEGAKDRLVLPREHLDFFMTSLVAAHEIDLLVLGYSALDTEVLELIRRSGCRVRRMTVVNRDAASALEVYDRIAGDGIAATWPDTFDGSYEQWIDRYGLQRWVEEFDGPYRSIMEPDRLRSLVLVREMEQQLPGRPRDGIMDEPW